MLQLTADRFSRSLSNFVYLRQLTGDLAIKDDKAVLGAAKDGLIKILGDLEDQLSPMGATFTARSVSELSALLKGVDLSAAIIAEHARDIERRLHHEFESITMLVIEKREAELYKNAGSLLDDKIAGLFPTSVDDFEEAAKSLALALPTACVFHSMRSAEAAAAIISGRLGGDVVDDKGEALPFGSLIMQIKTKIEEMKRGSERDAWLKLQGFLASVNRGSRTKVAHPGTFYTEAQAERLLRLTHDFLQEAEELLRP
jgi:hypothetical protein